MNLDTKKYIRSNATSSAFIPAQPSFLARLTNNYLSFLKHQQLICYNLISFQPQLPTFFRLSQIKIFGFVSALPFPSLDSHDWFNSKNFINIDKIPIKESTHTSTFTSSNNRTMNSISTLLLCWVNRNISGHSVRLTSLIISSFVVFLLKKLGEPTQKYQ